MLEPRVWILFCDPYDLLGDWDKEGPNQAVSNENEEKKDAKGTAVKILTNLGCGRQGQ